LGIATNRGIVTNRLLETRAANVYALGDCAEVKGHALFSLAPLMARGTCLGKNLGEVTTTLTLGVMYRVSDNP
tara:strand:- start:18322 stop:18540 length:219 start_codon:yes stop_codon:yes gene_type:complete